MPNDATSSGPIIRLPRTGCFITFIIFFAIAFAVSTALYHSLLEPKPDFEIPAASAAVCDPDGILTEEDSKELEDLARRIARVGRCDVLVLFADNKFEDFYDLLDTVRESWTPAKGVLLLSETRRGCLRLELLGGEWKLAGWDDDAVSSKLSGLPPNRRGAEAKLLLSRLLKALEAADAAAQPAAVSAGSQPAAIADAVQPANIAAAVQPAAIADAAQPANIAAAMQPAAVNAQPAAVQPAAVNAQPAAADEGIDDDFPDGDETFPDEDTDPVEEPDAEEFTDDDNDAVLYSRAWSTKSDVSPATFAILFASVFLLIGFLALRNGKKKRLETLKNNPGVQESYRERSARNSKLRLVDLNEEPSGFTHKPALKITAIILGIAVGWSSVSSVIHEEIQPDPDIMSAAADMPRPENGIADRAGVFSPEEVRMLAGVIAAAERKTGGEIMILTVPTTGDAGIEEFSLEVASRWQIGHAGVDDGALLVLAVNDRRNRLEIGYGWEGSINDARAGDILRAIVPKLRDEKYADASAEVVRSISAFVTGVRDEEDDLPTSSVRPAAPPPETVVIAGIVPTGGTVQDPRVNSSDTSLWALLGIVGSLTGLLLAYMGRVIMTSVPHLVIIDPTVKHYTSSSTGSSGSSSSSFSSRSSTSSSRRGGGSFGGGGASGSW